MVFRKYKLTYLFLVLNLFGAMHLNAQLAISPTNSFMVKGAVAAPDTVDIQQLEAFPKVFIDSIVITNHLGEVRHSIKNIKGVLLKNVLRQVKISTSSPKDLSKYYFAFVASDLYTVVCSWNELFNTPTGNQALIITEKDGKSIKDQSDRISIIFSSDYATGRRYLKGLKEIIIGSFNPKPDRPIKNK